MEETYLIAGLGNPGRNYAGTRHNAGFMVLDRLAKRLATVWEANRKFDAYLAKANRNGNIILLCKPQGYMNLSGQSVGPVAHFYRVANERVMVVVDDIDLPLGIIRMRPHGGTGGHRGLESIGDSLGKNNFPRLRLGVGKPKAKRDVSGFVLGRFAESESNRFETVLGIAVEQLNCWLMKGLNRAMNDYNGDCSPKEKERDDEIRRDNNSEGNGA